MLDPAILLHLQAPLPPSPPVMVYEQQWKSSTAVHMERVGKRLADGYEQMAEEWIAKLGTLKAQGSLLPTVPLSDEEVQLFAESIEDFEAYAEQKATETARMAKKLARDVKSHFAVDPSLGATTRAFGDKILATDHRVIEAVLDYALFLRAFRTERNPASRGGRVFDDPKALTAFLEDALA